MKRFYNNTLMRLTATRGLRLFALLCVLLGFSSSAWGSLTIPGSFNNWNYDQYIENNGAINYTVRLTAGNTYEFHIHDKNTSTNYGTNGGTMTRNSCTDWYINQSNTVCKITADVTGDYTFKYIKWDNAPVISVEYPSNSASVNCYLTGTFNNWNTSDVNYKMEVNPTNSNEYVIKGVSLSANAEVKVYYDGKYYGYEISVTAENGISISNSGNNIKFANAGTYDFYFDKSGSMKIYIGKGTGVTINSGDYIYMINFRPSNWGDCWRTGTGTAWVTLGENNYELILCEGTANSEGAIYKAQITTGGTFSTIKFGRGASVGTAWNVSGEIPLESGKNCATGWVEGGTTATWSFVNSCGDDPDDPDDPTPGDAPSCDEIEIWCRYAETGGTEMHCYAFNPDNESQHSLGDWPGSQKATTNTYNGNTYAVWTISDYDKLTIIFNNGGDECKTANLVGLTKGHRYIYDIPSGWCNSTISPSKTVDCSGGDIQVEYGTVYLDISSFKDWSTAGAIFKAKITTSAGEVDKDMIQCTGESNIYYVNEVLELNSITNLQIIRCDPANGNQWNYSAKLGFNASTPCLKVTGWDGTGSLTAYSGSCGVALESVVMITKDAVVDADGTTVSLYGYLSETYCAAIAEYGFVYCPGTATTGCIPHANSPRIEVRNGAQLYRGDVFSKTQTLPMGYTYGYKAYAIINDNMYLSTETGYFRLSDCTTRPIAGGDPITYTVDASLGEDYNDACKLTFGSLKVATEHLRDSYKDEDPNYRYVEYYNSQSYNLRQPVVIKVNYYDDSPDDDTKAYIYRGTSDVGKYAGNNKPKNSNLLENFNRDNADPEHTLTIKAGTKLAKPWIHHIVLRNSKNIVLDSLCIYSDPADYDAAADGIQTVGDNALEMDINVASGDADWHILNTQTGPGIVDHYLDNANILVQNCMIGSDGFTGMHISSYNGVTFKNNDFESVFNDPSSNAIAWGASAKFLFCKNVKFIQNNFRGDHATLMWIQEVKNMLVMNNVFWNTNKFLAGADDRNPSAMRLVTQWNDVSDVAFYYNTYFFANNGIQSNSPYDFMSFAETANINVSTVYFKYNNCYSYDLDCPGKSSNPFKDKDVSGTNFCPNNFWSEYDQKKVNNGETVTTSVFAFGCSSNTFTNVKGQVCSTVALTPASLIVKGDAMNDGSAPTAEELLGFTLTADEARADRYFTNVRPEDEGWTYGAYQSKSSAHTETIYWLGLTDDWDDRNNWEYETKKDPYDTSENPEMIRRRVSCVNTFSPNLKVVIEEIGTAEVAGGRKWPKIPSSFVEGRSNYDVSEHVSAGLQSAQDLGTQFAHSIELEYGAGLVGVENLTDGEIKRYSSAKMGFIAPRSQWILVGGVIKPFDGSGGVRDIKSGDYFKDYMPQVYMHQATIENGQAQWGATFASLEESITPNTVFALNIPDEYGDFKLPATYYNKYFSPAIKVDGTAPIEYTNFEGRFADDNGPRTYAIEAGQPNLINNTYPCNLDARVIESETEGAVMYYNYGAGTFMTTDATTDAILLKPQQGFIYQHASNNTLIINPETMLAQGNTRSRSTAEKKPAFSLNLYNANTGNGFSNIVVRYNKLQEAGTESSANVKKLFAPNAASPELYMLAFDNKYARLEVGSEWQVIPLGIRLLQDMNVKFERVYFEGINNVFLVDSYTGQKIDLLHRSYTTEKLMAGEIEGRYFLNIEVRNEDDYVPDDEVTTQVEDALETSAAINIYVDEAEGNVIKVVTNQVELQSIVVTDMVGRIMQYPAKGNYKELRLPVVQGVYVVQVIGDNATRTEKVILK